MMEFRMISLARNVARMGYMRNAYRILTGNLMEIVRLEDCDGGGRMTLIGGSL
jgi:hypothetical protein